MDTVLHDVRFAWRSLVRMRGAAVVIGLTMAIGIGATTAIFSVVYAALLRPVPFEDPDRIVMLYSTRSTAREGLQRLRWSMPEIASLVGRDAAIGSRVAALEDLG